MSIASLSTDISSGGDREMAEEEGLHSLQERNRGLHRRDTQDESIKGTLTLVMRKPNNVRPFCHEISIRPICFYRILVSCEGQSQSSI
jgi:hypothetical protein